MDLTKEKPDLPSWWILAFQNKGTITCIVDNGKLLKKQNIEKLKEKHGQFYEIFGDYPSQAIAQRAALDIEKQESLDPIFYPDKDIEKYYQSQLNNLSKDKLTIIDMGKLPPIYSALGIKDKELKTNIKAILKSQGIEGHNKHQISEETINNLLPLVYNPKAVFKSLSKSDNPDAYIAVLDAKTDKQEQIIAILSPSKDGQGFTFIPSVYEKHNFERFLERTHEEEKVLYVASKWKGSEIWGTLQSRPRHNSEPYINNIKDFGDIVKYFSQLSVHRTDENIINKENFMTENFGWYKSKHFDTGDEKEVELFKFNKESLNFIYPFDLKIEELKQNETKIFIYDDPECFSFDAPCYEKSISCDLKTGKKLIENTFIQLKTDFSTRPISYDTVCVYLEKNINALTQKSTVHRTDENIINKENFMTQEQEERTFRPSIDAAEKIAKEQAFKNALSQRKSVLNAIKDGTLACLPGANGFADTEPAVNLVSNDFYHGANMLYLKDHQKQNGFPTAEYVTEYQVEKAGLSINKEEKGRFIHWEQMDDQTGEWEKKHTLLFNVAQVSDPQAMKAFVEQQKQERFEKYVEKQRLDRGDPNYTPEQKQKTPGPIIECTSTDPEKYLGQYLAAVSMGGKFKVSSDQAAEFSKNMENSLLEQNDKGYPDPFKLSKISNAASQYCKDVKMEIKMETQKADYKLEQQQTQSRGHKL